MEQSYSRAESTGLYIYVFINFQHPIYARPKAPTSFRVPINGSASNAGNDCNLLGTNSERNKFSSFLYGSTNDDNCDFLLDARAVCSWEK